MTAIGALIAPQALAGPSVGVMSYNVRYGTANDGENAWPKRKQILANSIAQYTPQVVGVQECLAPQAEYLCETLRDYRWFGVGRDADGSGEMTAILYRYKEVMPMEAGHFWLSESPDQPGSVSWDSSLTRMATWIKFRHIASEARFYVFNTHFDHRGHQAREESAKLMTARIGELPEDAAVILTGDFNSAAETTAPYEVFIQSGMKDAWTSVETPVGPPITWSGFEAPKADTDRRIDWILFRGPVRAEHAETVTYNEAGRYPSDHFAVYARFALSE